MCSCLVVPWFLCVHASLAGIRCLCSCLFHGFAVRGSRLSMWDCIHVVLSLGVFLVRVKGCLVLGFGVQALKQ